MIILQKNARQHFEQIKQGGIIILIVKNIQGYALKMRANKL